MKKIILFNLILWSVSFLQAQTTPMAPETFFSMKAPSVPSLSNVCNTTNKKKTDYKESISQVMKETDDQIAYLRRDEKKNVSTMQEQAKQQMVTQYGLSAEDMQKMQSGKMTKEEKKAMADKVLQQQNLNITVDKAKEVSTYTKEGKQAWAESYAEQQKAEAEKDPKKNQETLEKNKKLYDLMQEKDLLNRKLTAELEKFGLMLQELETDTTAIRMLRDIDKMKEKFMSMVGQDYGQGPEMERLSGMIKSEKLAYCNRLTPKYLDVMGLFKEAVKKNMPDYYRLEVLTNEVNKMTTGSTVDLMQKGLAGYNAIGAYLGLLHDAYKYSIYDPEQPF